MKKYIFILVIAVSCSTKNTETSISVVSEKAEIKEEVNIPKELIGSWEAVTIITYSGSDTVATPIEHMGMSIMMTNNADGTFTDIDNGEKKEGKLQVNGDAVVNKFANGMQRTYKYKMINERLYYTAKMNGQLMTCVFVKE